MSESSSPSPACPRCGANLPAAATEGLCPRCLMAEAVQPTLASDAAKPRRPAILSPEDLAPQFAAYEFLRPLGRGGMGAVYLARQISLNRLVAIKILPADLEASDMGFANRFKNEALAMARLSHPGIVTPVPPQNSGNYFGFRCVLAQEASPAPVVPPPSKP